MARDGRVLDRERFEALAASVTSALGGREGFSLHLAGEQSSFVRMSRGRVRQPGDVVQHVAELSLFRGARRARRRISLSGVPTDDDARMAAAVARLRDVLDHLPEDPHLARPDAPVSSEEGSRGAGLPSAEHMVDVVLDAAGGSDLVGILAAGPQVRAFADERGQRNWFEKESFLLDFSVYLGGDGEVRDRAAKDSLAGATFDAALVEDRVARARRTLPLLGLAPRTLSPGKVRALLSPAAVAELMDLVGPSSFGRRAVKTRRSGLGRLFDGQAAFDPRVSLVDDLAGGLSPRFSAEGFVRPERVVLVEGGRAVGALTSPRSSREYGEPSTGCDESEQPLALALAPGDLDDEGALRALGTGLYVSDLWYSNWSDRASGRVTAMTRFATLWVENGEPVAPVSVMRIDDSLFRIFGDQLEAIGAYAPVRADADTYGQRATRSLRVPGLLLRELELAL